MNSEQHKNIEHAIDGLCENIVWTRAYHRALMSLHSIAKANPFALDPYPQLISCMYHGLFDALFLRLYHFVDKTKGASGLPALFKMLRRYCDSDRDLLIQVADDEKHLGESAGIKKIDNWRNQIVAHMTASKRNRAFFSDNRLHLSEIDTLIEILEKLVQQYSFRLLQRGNDMKPPSEAVATEITTLMRHVIERNEHNERVQSDAPKGGA